uniref:Uncharacterized protein n=1 Tax=Arundo donax TaxID=35708 RepID=A0A0A9EZ62_ARUDO
MSGMSLLTRKLQPGKALLNSYTLALLHKLNENNTRDLDITYFQYLGCSNIRDTAHTHHKLSFTLHLYNQFLVSCIPKQHDR